MNTPTFTAEASIYRTSGYYSAAGMWAQGFGTHVDPSQLALPNTLPNGGGCACKPRIGPCVKDSSCSSAQDPVGHSRATVDCDCNYDTICCIPPCLVTCGPCTGGSCNPYPNCGPIAGSGTQTCTDCHGNKSTRSC